ncbi:uncharacterized protein LOC119951692 isoform X2 [Scyliorhinus canicula]|uniref:uncharacterized protein LOC119951692 isoform X2 n=1 Tax=Scyliorhinus canicula TaxID=7830 RepID=UPI0018F678C3|nr:uncharacterized protein LOC119951692 isoform X2 [Scyliorhinus canicula]
MRIVKYWCFRTRSLCSSTVSETRTSSRIFPCTLQSRTAGRERDCSFSKRVTVHPWDTRYSNPRQTSQYTEHRVRNMQLEAEPDHSQTENVGNSQHLWRVNRAGYAKIICINRRLNSNITAEAPDSSGPRCYPPLKISQYEQLFVVCLL